jgi:hypothetical protein
MFHLDYAPYGVVEEAAALLRRQLQVAASEVVCIELILKFSSHYYNRHILYITKNNCCWRYAQPVFPFRNRCGAYGRYLLLFKECLKVRYKFLSADRFGGVQS